MDGQYEDYPPPGTIDNDFESYQDYNEQDYSVDWINTKNPQEMSLYQRRMVAGQSFKLPDEPTISDAQWESFKGTFMSDLNDDVNEKAKSFRYLWEDEDDNPSSTRPPYGVAKNMIQLAKFLENNKILREDIEFTGHGNDDGKPSETAWTAIKGMTTFVPFKIEPNDSPTNTAIEPTQELHRKIIDCIINYMTNEYYVDAALKKHPNQNKTAPHPGAVTQLYFDDYSENVKIMRKAYKCGQVLLTSDLSPNSTAGFYPNYTAVMNAVQRRYGRCQTQDTMMDLFRKINKVFKDKGPFEFKIGLLRNLLKKHYITDKKEFFVCKDFEDDRNKQSHPEGWTPIVATFAHYVSFLKTIDESRWDGIETELSNLVQGKLTYKSWRENRQELYKLLDKEVKKKHPTVNRLESSAIYNIDADESIDDMTDADLVAFVRQRRQNYRKMSTQTTNQKQGWKQNGQKRFDPNFKKSYPPQNKPVRRPNSGRPNNQYRSLSNQEKKDGLRKLLCRNCSRWAGANRYHQGPYGGTPESMCPIDDKGRPRAGFKFVRAYYGTDVNAIGVEDYRDIETDGIEYEQTSVNNVEHQGTYNYGADLINQSIGGFE